MISHHLDTATLMSCAAGSQPEALAAVTVAHLAVCPACTAKLADAHTIGEVLFASLKPTALSHGVPTPSPTMPSQIMKSPVMPSLQRPTQPASTTTGGVPLPLVGVIGPDLADITWDQVTTGIWTAPVPLSETANGELHLLKLAPGVTQPSARSSGSKLAIVLAGSYLDGDQTYLPGDVADLDDQAHHQIAADAKTGCICLIAADR